jgi:hypothetical protein
MKYVIAIVLVIHGFAHWVGFVVPWRIAKLEEAPYKTTLLGGRLDVGDAGIRMVGLLWLLAGISFFVSGIALLASAGWWFSYTLVVAGISLVLCILGLPEAKLGIPVNVVIMLYLLVGKSLGWLSALGL